MRFSIYIGLRVGLSLVNILAISGCMGISVERLQTAEDIQGHSRLSLIETKFWSRTASMQCVQINAALSYVHVARSVVFVSMCLCVCVLLCWGHGWAVQKRLNRLMCLARIPNLTCDSAILQQFYSRHYIRRPRFSLRNNKSMAIGTDLELPQIYLTLYYRTQSHMQIHVAL